MSGDQSLSRKVRLLLSVSFIGFLSLSLVNCTSPDATSSNLSSSSTTSTTSLGTTSSTASSASSPSQQTAAPSCSPAAGTYTGIQTVTISSTTPGASIRYTTDGSTPTETLGTEYSTTISVETSETIKAIAYKAGMTDSVVASAAYSIGGTIATPSFSPLGGTYSGNQAVTVSSDVPGAAIHYTTDGSMPSSSSPISTTAITVAGNGTSETIKAIATAEGMQASNVGSATYVINNGSTQVLPPIFDPPGGTYSSDQSVALSCATTGAVIHYTTDGSTPTDSSTVYTKPLSVAGNGAVETIRAVAIGGKNAVSSVETGIFTISSDSTAWQTIGSIGSSANNFKYPAGVAVDPKGHIYVVDQGNSRIVRMDDMSGANWITLGSKSDRSTQLKNPAGIAIDAQGKIYVADQGNSRIVRVDDVTGSEWAAFGSFGSGSNQFINPAGVAVDAQGRIYVVDQGNSRIVCMDDMNGTGWTAFGKRGSGSNQFRDPAGVSLDANGHIYIADYANNRIVRLDDMMGTNWTSFGSSGSGANHLRYPTGIHVDLTGHIFIDDMINNRIVRLDDMSGTNWTTVGAAVSLLNHPWGIDVDAAGNIYITDMLNNRLVRSVMP